MSMLETGLVGLLIVIAFTLVAIVLVQRGKGADIGAAFGSGASNTVFGSSGSLSFLTKTTAWLAFAFFLVSFGLAYTARERAESAGEVGIPQVTEMAEQSENGGQDAPPSDEDYPEIPEFEEIPELPPDM
ncbi:MAG: preprotein translocase subunit SecG [Gammaproteobacteria bacterium]|nr:preprotein translocase subunit SecG [Gammaproteobacteria bacterium]MCY4323033.1 preprotein translocase subunit SecG [Gammaproteobacteria bacterium]